MSLRITESAAETEAVGAALAAELAPGDVVLISGEVGAGKSTLIRGAARALGVAGAVQSPTFTIGRRHAGSRCAVSHLDLYRLADAGAVEPGLLDDYLTADAIGFVEWPEAAEVTLEEERVTVARVVSLRHAGGDRREIEISAPVAGPPRER